MDTFRILFVEDTPEVLDVLTEFLGGLGYETHVAESGEEALTILDRMRVTLVFADLHMPNMDGIELLGRVKKQWPEIEVIILTGHGSIQSAIQALRLGAYDYLEKPVELQRLKVLVERVQEKTRLIQENDLFRQRLKDRYRLYDFVGVAPKIQEILDLIEKVAPSTSSVFIHGESGTGKELVARTIHTASGRRELPFIPVNCGAIVEQLLESELFGHRKGAFTGAIRDKDGLFKAASGGTLFLDEVAEMSPGLQVKLLRALQDKKIRPVGDTGEIAVDVRVIAATNGNVEDCLSKGLLRLDLYYRLNVVSICLPPLKERKEDIPLLANHFIKRFNEQSRRKILGVSSECLDALLRYHWPGNVRQLENVIERAFALGTEERIMLQDLPMEIMQQARDRQHHPRSLNLKENELLILREAIERAKGKRGEVAKLLGVDASTVYRKLRKYGLEDASIA